MKIRILPIVIILCALFIVTRIIDMVKGESNLSNFIIENIYAAGEETLPDENNKVKQETKKDIKEAVNPNNKSDDKVKQTNAENILEKKKEENKKFCSEAEITLYKSLALRREELDARENELNKRTNILAATEKSIDNKLDQLTGLKSELETLLKAYNDQQNKEIESLVKIYESMKPDKAARIFEQLDMDVLLLVIDKMKEAKVAPMLAQMDPMKAKEITLNLANKKKLSTPDINVP